MFESNCEVIQAGGRGLLTLEVASGGSRPGSARLGVVGGARRLQHHSFRLHEAASNCLPVNKTPRIPSIDTTCDIWRA